MSPADTDQTARIAEQTERLAELLVRFGANVQPGQIVGISSEPGKEALARAIAAQAYRAGAKFVDVVSFDPHIKRARALNADPDTLGWVPPWYGDRMLALGDLRGATINIAGPVEPGLMDDVDPDLLGRDMLPRIKESNIIIRDQSVNWTIGPAPTAGWAGLVYPNLEPAAAIARLWDELAHICRLTDPDPVAAWNQRLDRLKTIAQTLTEMKLDRLHYEGPGTDLTVGLLPSSTWIAADFTTAGGIVHHPNIPTEEVFTSPDPTRTEGHVTATKPLYTASQLITGLRMRFEAGRAVAIDADQGAGTLRTLTTRDPGGARLGEVALVDRDSRIGQLGTVFYETLLDENAASHIALGQGFQFALSDPAEHPQLNASEIHIDFMIGSNDLDVTGITQDGTEIPLLREGAWQIA